MQKIIFSGLKHSGKSTIGRLFAHRLSINFYDLDQLILNRNKQYTTIRELYNKCGENYFQKQELFCLKEFFPNQKDLSYVLSLGGGTIDNSKATHLLDTEICKKVFLNEQCDVLFKRISKGGLPPFLSEKAPYEDFKKLFEYRKGLNSLWANFEINLMEKKPSEIVDILVEKLI